MEKDFKEFVANSYPDAWKDAKKKLSGLDSDDLDFFAEAFRVKRVRRRSSAGKGDSWVGMIVGHVSLRDLMSKQRDLAIEQAEIDLNNVLRHGIRPYNNDNTVSIGRAHYAEGAGRVSNAMGNCRPQQVILHRTHGCKGAKESNLIEERVAIRWKHRGEIPSRRPTTSDETGMLFRCG